MTNPNPKFNTFHILNNQGFRSNFFIKSQKLEKPEYKNHFRLGYFTPLVLGNKGKVYIHGMISNIILFTREDFEIALESKLSLKRLTNYFIDDTEKDILNHYKTDYQQLNYIQEEINQKSSLNHDLLKRGLLFNNFYNQSENEIFFTKEKHSQNPKDYQISFEKLFFSFENSHLQNDLKLESEKIYLPLEIFPGFKNLENLAGIIYLTNSKGTDSFYFYMTFKPFLEHLTFVENLDHFENNFRNQATTKVKDFIVSNIYGALSHSEYLNFDHTIYND